MSDVAPAQSRRPALIVAQFLHMTAFATWLGSIVFTCVAVAPVMIQIIKPEIVQSGTATIESGIAGKILTAVFHGLSEISLISSIAMVVAGLFQTVLGAGARHKFLTSMSTAIIVVLIVIVGYQLFHILPLMDRPSVRNTTLFQSLHAQYGILTVMQIVGLLVVAGLTASRDVPKERP